MNSNIKSRVRAFSDTPYGRVARFVEFLHRNHVNKTKQSRVLKYGSMLPVRKAVFLLFFFNPFTNLSARALVSRCCFELRCVFLDVQTSNPSSQTRVWPKAIRSSSKFRDVSRILLVPRTMSSKSMCPERVLLFFFKIRTVPQGIRQGLSVF